MVKETICEGCPLNEIEDLIIEEAIDICANCPSEEVQDELQHRELQKERM